MKEEGEEGSEGREGRKGREEGGKIRGQKVERYMYM